MSAALLSHEMIPVEFINWAEYSPEFRLEFGMRGLRGKTPPAPPLDQSQSHTKKSPASCYQELCFRPDSQWRGSGPVRCRWLPLQPQCYVLPDAFYWLRSCTAPKMKKEKRKELRTAVLDSSQNFSPTPPGPMPSPFLQGPGAHYLRAVSGCWQIPQLWVAVALCYLLQSSPFFISSLWSMSLRSSHHLTTCYLLTQKCHGWVQPRSACKQFPYPNDEPSGAFCLAKHSVHPKIWDPFLRHFSLLHTQGNICSWVVPVQARRSQTQ